MWHWNGGFIDWWWSSGPADWLVAIGTIAVALFALRAYRNDRESRQKARELERKSQARKVWYETGLRAYLWEDFEKKTLKPTLDLVVHNQSAEPIYDVVVYVPSTPVAMPMLVGPCKAIGWKMVGPGVEKPVSLVTDSAVPQATLPLPVEGWQWFPQMQFNDSAGIRWTRDGEYLFETAPEYMERLPAGSP